MHLNTRPKFISFSLKTLSAAVISALLFSNAHAAGLGKLTVLSSLGQPLHAEIELNAVSKDDVGTLVPKLASTDAFRQANIDFNPALFSLRFAVEQRAGRQFIRITSTQPINEPFVDMLLELNGGGNRLVREYTFLLDPADLRSSQSPQVAAPIILPPAPLTRRELAPAPAQVQPEVIVPRPPMEQKPIAVESQQKKVIDKPAKRAPLAPPVSAPDSNAPSSEYQVKLGDSLSKIAAQVKPESVSLDQMLIALYRANPDAFLDSNMNRLRAGQILSVPDSATVADISNSEARDIIVAQAADFNSYRNKLAGKVAAAAPKKSAETKQSATGKITTKVEEPPTAANTAKDKLELSKSGKPAGRDKTSTIAAGTEDRIAKDKAIAEAKSRVEELEKNVSELQKLLVIKNKNLEEQQKQADAAKAATKPTVSPAVAPVAVPSVPVKPAEVKPAEIKPAEVKPAEVKPPEVKAAEVKPAPIAPLDKPAAESVAAPASAPPVVAAVIKPKPVVAPPPKPGFFDDMLEPVFLALGVGLVALGGFGIYSYSSRRKKQKKNFEDSIITDSSLKANSLFGSTGGQSVDTNNSVFNSNFTPSSSSLDTNEVDPVAEADVYIAYGRDAQAEEILKEALRTQPTRNAVRVKLLEIYSNRKDLRAFEVLASELYGITKGEGDEWVQAASLGLGIDPNNPLYAAGKVPENAVAKAAPMSAPTQPLDEPDLDALLAVTQADRSLETINTLENSSYFGNTSLASEVPSTRAPEPPVQQSASPAAAAPPNELDFDLDGLGLDQIAVPNTIAPTPQVEAKADFNDLNFDFMQDNKPVMEPVEMLSKAVVEADTAVIESLDIDDLSSIQTDFSDAGVQPSVAVSPESSAGALEFDLSDITLELNPADAKSEPVLASLASPAEENQEYSNSAEMATKLDLAVAYQEIGDKEGARELLDEVVKGGTPEQTQKAKSILHKLG